MTKYPKKFEPKKVQGTNFYRTEVSKTKLFVSFILPFEFKKKKKKHLYGYTLSFIFTGPRTTNKCS